MDKPASRLQTDRIGLPDLTDTLQQGSKRLAGTGSFGTVYRCLCAQNGEVAVKAISFPRSFNEAEKNEFLRASKMRRGLDTWSRLDHPNIVRFLGAAHGEDFGSDYPCMVLMWMPHGTLADFIMEHEDDLPLPNRVRLIMGSAAGLAHLHSKFIIHGNLHPRNILIDNHCSPRLADFCFHDALIPRKELTYMSTHSTRPGAAMWIAPELSNRELFSDLMTEPAAEPTLYSDIYSLGTTIIYILLGQLPWSAMELESRLQDLQHPPRPSWSAIPSNVWDFIEKCRSPRVPRDRPTAHEVLSFSESELERSFQPNATSDINVVLFGAFGCGKSSIINILAESQIAPVSTSVQPYTRYFQRYQIPIGGRRFQFWDTTGFHPPQGGGISPSLPYEQAYTVLRSLPDGIHLILLCARKDDISPSLGNLYWFINDIFFSGHAPVALVVTHFDTPEQRWWERNERFIATKTGIPVQNIPRICTTTVDTGYDHSREMLKSLLETNAITPIPLCLKPLSQKVVNDISTRCRLDYREVNALVKTLRRPRHINQEDARRSATRNSCLDPRPEECLSTFSKSSANSPGLGRWLPRPSIRKRNDDPSRHIPGQLPGECQLTDHRSRSASLARVTTANETLSMMSAHHGVGPNYRSEDASLSGQEFAEPKERSPVQQMSNSRPRFSTRLKMLTCLCSNAEEGTH